MIVRFARGLGPARKFNQEGMILGIHLSLPKLATTLPVD